LLDCFAKDLLAKRAFVFGGFDHGLAFVVADGEVGTTLDKQGNCVVVDGGEDGGFAVVIPRVDVCTELDELFFDIGEERLMEGGVAVVVTCVDVGSGLCEQANAIDSMTIQIGGPEVSCSEDSGFSLLAARLEFWVEAENFGDHVRVTGLCGEDENAYPTKSMI
jgi:hypothetical protein